MDNEVGEKDRNLDIYSVGNLEKIIYSWLLKITKKDRIFLEKRWEKEQNFRDSLCIIEGMR